MTAAQSIVDTPDAMAEVVRLQRRTLAVLSASQILGSFGTVTGISVGVLLAATLAGTAVSGLAQSIVVVGQGLLAVPVSRLMERRGRRIGLAGGYVIGAVGAALTVVAADVRSAGLLLIGLLLFGGAGAGNYLTRYAAADLSPPEARARHIALILWAATLGAVLGPNLAAATDRLARDGGFVPYAGPFLASAVGFGLAALVLALLLRPDPLLVARRRAEPITSTSDTGRRSFRSSLRAVVATSRGRLGLSAIVAGHAAMIAVMAMTPVYIGQIGHSHDETLRILGVTIGAHVIGMYAFSPLFGALADRVFRRDGRRAVILLGLALLLIACAVSGTAGHNATQLAIGLGLVGLGWSAMLVAGSTLLTESVAREHRPGAQGAGDLLMNLAAAVAGALAGLVTAWSGFPTLTVVVAAGLLPVVALALRPSAARPVAEA